MANAITAIGGAVTPAALWANIAEMAPLIGTMIVFAFGYMLYRKFVKGTSKGRARG